MRNSLYLGIVAAAITAASCAGSSHTSGKFDGNASASSGGSTMSHVGGAFSNAAHTTTNAFATAGHATVYGARETAQSLSGHQGDPASEARSAEARANMERNAHQTGQYARGTGRETVRIFRPSERTTAQGTNAGATAGQYSGDQQRRTVHGRYSSDTAPSAWGGGPKPPM
jgi:hypothetical protein